MCLLLAKAVRGRKVWGRLNIQIDIIIKIRHDNQAAFGPQARRPPSSIPRHAACSIGTAFARHRPRGLRGDLANHRRPTLTKCRPLHWRTECFSRWSSCFRPLGSQTPAQFFAMPACSTGTAFARHGSRGLRGIRKSLATQFDQMPPVALTYRLHGIYTAWAQGTLGGSGKSSGTQFDKMPPVAVTYRLLP